MTYNLGQNMWWLEAVFFGHLLHSIAMRLNERAHESAFKGTAGVAEAMVSRQEPRLCAGLGTEPKALCMSAKRFINWVASPTQQMAALFTPPLHLNWIFLARYLVLRLLEYRPRFPVVAWVIYCICYAHDTAHVLARWLTTGWSQEKQLLNYSHSHTHTA